MKKTILFLTVTLVTFGLGYLTGVTKKSVAEKFEVVSEAIQTPEPSTKENFKDFIYRFIADSAFQLQRVKFPLRAVGYFKLYDGVSTPEPDTLFTEATNWKTTRLFGSEKFKAQIYDNFDLQLRDTNERVFCWEGVENGVNIQFKFSRIDGQWYLIEYVDLSD